LDFFYILVRLVRRMTRKLRLIKYFFIFVINYQKVRRILSLSANSWAYFQKNQL
jgi:hypothetical protein